MAEIKTTKNGSLIKLKGSLKGDAAETLKTDIIGLLRDGSKTITLDLAQVTEMDAKGLAVIAAAFKSIERDEGILKIKNITRALWPLFEYSRLDRFMEITAKK